MDKLVFKLFCLAALVAVFSSLMAGCKGTTGYSTKQIPYEKNREPKVYFCPKNDCGKVYSSYIKSANHSVHCAFYDIDLDNVIRALANKSRTAEVMLVMDSSNYDEQVKGDGIKLDDDRQLMHNKFCVIDDNVVITGSFNPTENDNYKNQNNIVVMFSKILAKNYEDEFEELWNGKFGKGDKIGNSEIYINNKKIENYFCPEDNCASHLIELIKNARHSIYFMTFSFTNENVADALAAKNYLNVKGVFDSQQASIQYSQFKRLQELGIKAKKDSNKYKMHHKVFIIDNSTVVTGSFNPTLSADTKNDENMLIIHDSKIADAFLEEFDRLWG